jgi:5-methylcytosine-specific restriction endonuclease McrA
MNEFVRTHLSDHGLLRDLATHFSDEHAAVATFLADLAETDARKLYLPAAYDSMRSYCVGELRMTRHAAFRRIAVARTARQIPALFHALAGSRLNLTAVLLLRRHLTPETAGEPVSAAAGRTKEEIRLLLAERFPKPDVPSLVRKVAAPTASSESAAPQLALERVGPNGSVGVSEGREPLSAARANVDPLSPGRYALQFTVDQATYDKLRYAHALLGRALPTSDVGKVFERALDALVHVLEKQKFAKCDRPRAQRGAPKGRHVPAEVKRTVWKRDAGRCTFVSGQGKRCDARADLQFDHVEPYARGGRATVGNIRLRCRAHNQYDAEQVYGERFMVGKREAQREQAEQSRVAKAGADASARVEAEAGEQQDVIPWLRELGYNRATAQKGAAACAHIPDAPLDERLKVALRALAPRCIHVPAPSGSCPA